MAGLSYKRILDSYIIYLRENLRIADISRQIKNDLLSAVTNKEYFSAELVESFQRLDPDKPFTINPNAPSQIAAIKKIINALENAEQSFRSIEQLNIKNDRYTAGITADIAQVAYKAVHEIYATLQLVNHSSIDIQNIVGPHIKTLLPYLAMASKALNGLAPQHPEENVGVALASAVSVLPTKKATSAESMGNLSDFIFKLPQHFEQLHDLITTGTKGVANKSITSAHSYRAQMLAKAKDTQQYFEHLNKSASILAIPSYVAIAKRLIAHSSNLLNTAAPLSKQAYLEAASMLQDIKHDMLPQLIAELEQVEESMSLKAGILTQPVLDQMSKFYTQLAEQVNNIAKVADVIDDSSEIMNKGYVKVVRLMIDDRTPIKITAKLTPIPDLEVMMDDVFVAKRRENQLQRLGESQLISQDQTSLSAAISFFDKLSSYNALYQSLCKWSLANIHQKEKDEFISEYKQFQPYLASLYPDIDKLIVDALTIPTDRSLIYRALGSQYKQLWGSNHFTQVSNCKDAVIASIKQQQAQAQFKGRMIKNTIEKTAEHNAKVYDSKQLKLQLDKIKQDKTALLEQTHKASIQQPLLAIGKELEKANLFGMISDLKLSKSIDHFLNTKLQDYLKNNLSLPIWKQLATEDGKKLDTSKIPYLEFHNDSPEVQLYKKLIDALYYLQQGFAEIEGLQALGDPNNFATRSRYLMKAFNGLVMNICFSKSYLIEETNNPQLLTVLKEGLGLLEPLKNIPIIGDYIANADILVPPKPQNINILEQWKHQQAIVASVMQDQPVPAIAKPLHPAAEPAQAAAIKPTFIQLIAEQLRKVSKEYNKYKKAKNEQEEELFPGKEEIDAKIKAFTKSLEGLSYDAISVKKILNAIDKLQTRFYEMSAKTRTVTMAHLKEIRSEFGVVLMAAADNAEYHLGLKPGTYSSYVSDRFDRFYEAFITNLPLEKDQEGLELLLDATSTQKRLANEKKRLAGVENSQLGLETETLIFGADHEAFDTAYQSFLVIKKTVDGARDVTNIWYVDHKELVVKIADHYKKIQPLLAKVDSKFTPNYLSAQKDTTSLYLAVDELIRKAPLANPTKSSFLKLKNLALHNKFERQVDKELFLQCYKELQPYLIKVDYTYDTEFFLRELQTPQDFTDSLNKILNDEVKLHQLVLSAEKTKQMNIQLCRERIDHFYNLLDKQAKEISSQKIHVFKEKIFTNYLNNEILNKLKAEIGDDASLFLEHILPDLLSAQNDIFKDLTIKDDIEEQIGLRIEERYPAIREQHIDTFMKLLFNQHIETAIKKPLTSDLGFYTEYFMLKLAPEFEEHKASILKTTGFNKITRQQIKTQMDALYPAMLHKNKELTEAYTQLNATLQRIDKVLVTEQQAKDKINPCRNEKIVLLTAFKEKLTNLPKPHDAETLAKIRFEVEESLKSLEHYDALINVYAILETLVSSTKVNAVLSMQQIIVEKRVPPQTRLKEVIEQLSNTVASNQQILSYSDNILVGKAYKSQVFDNYIASNIKEKLSAELGPYAALFLKVIVIELIIQKTGIIDKLVFADLEQQIMKALEPHLAIAEEENQDLKNICHHLYNTSIEIELLMKAENNKAKANPCRKEKIAYLESCQQLANNTPNIERSEIAAFLQKQKTDLDTKLNALSLYDEMIAVYDLLNEMKELVENNEEYNASLKREKIQEIANMQFILAPHESSFKPAAERLADIKDYGSSDLCKQVLIKNSDSSFVAFFKAIFRILNGESWESADELKFSKFKDRLGKIKLDQPSSGSKSEARPPT